MLMLRYCCDSYVDIDQIHYLYSCNDHIKALMDPVKND